MSVDRVKPEVGDVVVAGEDFGIVIESFSFNEMDDEDLQDLDDMGFRGYKVLVNNEIKQYTCAALWLVNRDQIPEDYE
jgi:hypothetical protein